MPTVRTESEVTTCGLARSRRAGDDRERRAQSLNHGLPLLGIQRQNFQDRALPGNRGLNVLAAQP